MADSRTLVARYYDATTRRTDDIPFYADHIQPDHRTVLELGCGTGRVLLPLAEHCDLIVGVEKSRAMLDVCKEKLTQGQSNVEVVEADITALDLGRRFGLITAPFRVMQNVETDQDIDRLFDTIDRHMAPTGACILNVFSPNTTPEEIIASWGNEEENEAFEVPYMDGILKQFYVKRRCESSPLVLYPEIIYRYYANGKLAEEASFTTTMRVFYPDEFTSLIEKHGFEIVDRWGGYTGERYGEGPELVVKFQRPQG